MRVLAELGVRLFCVAWEWSILALFFLALALGVRPPRWYNGGP